MTDRRVFAVGCSAALQAQLSAELQSDVVDGPPGSIEATDVVLLAADTIDDRVGNPFAACLRWKRECAKATIIMVLSESDAESEPIARFSLANGSVRVSDEGALLEPESLQSLAKPEFREVPIDALLARFESQLESSDTSFAEIVERHSGHDFIDGLTDDETGLFDGPFATFKLDEEYKRAVRFHQPLSMILFDCGADLPDDEIDRRTVLAEIASVFLNECRDIDTLARFTETVFLFLLPGTGSEGASAVARRMLEGLRERDFCGGAKVEPAAGIATVPTHGIGDRSEFLRAAEACLRSAREAVDGVCVL